MRTRPQPPRLWRQTWLTWLGEQRKTAIIMRKAFFDGFLPWTVPVLIIGFLSIYGCSTIQTGADPLIVNAERLQSSIGSTFDTVLAVEYSNPGFWKTNTPAFYQFCEELKAPVAYVSPEYGTTNLPKILAAQLQLDDAKKAYEASASQSNALFSAEAVLQSLLASSTQWLMQVTNPPPTTTTAPTTK
jgi:hypothetical protein